MKIVKQINHPVCKVTVFSWNEKYLIKCERGLLEQTYKVSELDIMEEDLDQIVTDEFMESVASRFEAMDKSFNTVLEGLDE